MSIIVTIPSDLNGGHFSVAIWGEWRVRTKMKHGIESIKKKDGAKWKGNLKREEKSGSFLGMEFFSFFYSPC